MEQVLINGGNIVSPPIPAGTASRNIAGAAPVTLTLSESAAETLILSGAITAGITITVPVIPQALQVVGTPALYTGSPLLLNGWVKIIQNNTTGAFGLTFTSGAGGTVVMAAATQGKSQIIFSPDGVNLFFAGSAN